MYSLAKEEFLTAFVINHGFEMGISVFKHKGLMHTVVSKEKYQGLQLSFQVLSEVISVANVRLCMSHWVLKFRTHS